MSLFSGRRGALNSAASFPGIGGAQAQQPAAPAAAAKPKGDDDDMTAREKEQAERDEKRRARNKKAGRAEDDDGDDDEEVDPDEEGGDDSDEDDMKKGSKSRASALRMRARCAAIFASQHAVGRESLAAQIAFATTLPRGQAIAMLEKAPRAGASLADRMAGQPHNAGAGAAPVAAADHGKSILASAFDANAVTYAKPNRA